MRLLLWLGTAAADYGGIYVTDSSGWRVGSPGHFSERHSLIAIIALGESIVAMGMGMSGFRLTAAVLGAAAAGLLLSAALWRLYFRQLGKAAEHRLAGLSGDARTRFGQDVYTFLHLPLVAGAVLCALGMKKVVHQVADTGHYGLAEPLHGVVAWSLTGGVGVFPLGPAAIVLRSTGRRPTALAVGGLCCLVAGPLVGLVPALVALVLLGCALSLLVALHARRPSTAPAPANGPWRPWRFRRLTGGAPMALAYREPAQRTMRTPWGGAVRCDSWRRIRRIVWLTAGGMGGTDY